MIDSSKALNYYKEVLGRISFADRAVFRKELRKAFKRLMPEERAALKQWFRSSCLCRPAFSESQLEPVRVKEGPLGR
jgi:hypothetical protein